MSRQRTHLLGSLLLLLAASLSFQLLSSVVPAAAAEARGLWVPRPHAGYEVKEGRILYRRGGAGLMLECPDAAGIGRYYAERGASGIGDPFGHLGPEVQTGAIFLLTLINRTAGSLTFTPNMTILRIHTDAAFAMDFTVLIGLLDQSRPGFRKIMDNSIYHSPETVQSGQVTSKFLIYPSLPKKAREIRLDFDSLFFEDRDARTSFYFDKK